MGWWHGVVFKSTGRRWVQLAFLTGSCWSVEGHGLHVEIFTRWVRWWSWQIVLTDESWKLNQTWKFMMGRLGWRFILRFHVGVEGYGFRGELFIWWRGVEVGIYLWRIKVQAFFFFMIAPCKKINPHLRIVLVSCNIPHIMYFQARATMSSQGTAQH